MIQFSRPTLNKQEDDAVRKVLYSGWLAQGPETTAFEAEFAKYVGVKYAVFTNSCTSALKMAFKYFYDKGFLQYDLLTRNTYCATYAAAEEMGMSQNCITGVRVATHYGSIKYDRKCEIEDSAHRIEPNDPLIGKIRCYSFHATKNMTTGTGGMFVTNSKEIYERARLWQRDGLSNSTADRGIRGNYQYKVIEMVGGYESNDIAATIGRVQLSKLPSFTQRRNEIREQYNNAFRQQWAGNHLYEYFVSSEEEVKSLIRFMKNNGVQCSYHYPNNGWLGVSLPIYPLLTDSDVEYIISKVLEWRKKYV